MLWSCVCLYREICFLLLFFFINLLIMIIRRNKQCFLMIFMRNSFSLPHLIDYILCICASFFSIHIFLLFEVTGNFATECKYSTEPKKIALSDGVVVKNWLNFFFWAYGIYLDKIPRFLGITNLKNLLNFHSIKIKKLEKITNFNIIHRKLIILQDFTEFHYKLTIFTKNLVKMSKSY